jgi:predicted aldo/keto reductase-like oxidoreductase
MRTIPLGRSALAVSAVGLGGVQFSKLTRAQVARAIRQALDCGITFFETAYGYFDSEEKMGPALRRRRGGVILASKSSARDGRTFSRHLDESLRRLRTDVIDIYQLHGVDSAEALEQTLRLRGAVGAAKRAIRQGKVRSLGLTTHSLEMALRAVEMDLFETVQYPISLINTEVPRSGLLGKARRHNVGLIAMKPLGGGRLGKARLALSYIYRFRGVVPVVGVETPEQVRQLARIAERPTKLAARHLERIRRIRRAVGRTFCRACRYCEPCPKGIAIFRVLYFPVYVKQMGAERVLRHGVPDWLVKAERCIQCRRCEGRCPFHLEIVEGMKGSLHLARQLAGDR